MRVFRKSTKSTGGWGFFWGYAVRRTFDGAEALTVKRAKLMRIVVCLCIQ